jgi:hypothetical protein
MHQDVPPATKNVAGKTLHKSSPAEITYTITTMLLSVIAIGKGVRKMIPHLFICHKGKACNASLGAKSVFHKPKKCSNLYASPAFGTKSKAVQTIQPGLLLFGREEHQPNCDSQPLVTLTVYHCVADNHLS